MTFVIIKNKN